ncbi:MAG: lipoyl(octanoyl) transferase LipB [bacterium]
MKALAIFLDGPVAYDVMSELQERLLAARIAGEIGDIVLFLEHLPVVTIGRRGDTAGLLKSPRALARGGVALVHSTRGGNITYHAPGQLILYPILALSGAEADIRGYTSAMEEVAIRTAAGFGVTAFRRGGMTGAWTDHGKLAAIGVRLKRWTTSHGMSFNVDVDLTGFEVIVPCGLKNERVTSLKSLLGKNCPGIGDVRDRIAREFSDVFGRRLEIRRVPGADFLRDPVACWQVPG